MPTLHWIGKEKVVNHHAEVPFRVLEKKYHFSAENGENFEGNSENKIIHGDNLEALKSLLPQYEGKIKCIYIDPPYNTGNEGWVYNDNSNHPKIKKWLGETVGKEGEDLSRHDKWLCMMYPRLKLLHKLLAEDGVIFVSIDDNEQAHLKLMMDEIFGGGNFIGNIIWESKTKTQNTKTSYNKLQPKTEYILLFTKRDKRRFNLVEIGNKEYPEEDENGVYRNFLIEIMNAEGMRGRETMVYPILGINPPVGKQWKLGLEKINEFQERGDLFILNKKPYIKMRPFDERSDITKPFWGFFPKEIGTAETGKKELNTIFYPISHGFETVKPSELVKQLIFHSTTQSDIILDSFAGSGTTFHAVLNLNKQDGGNRKCILIEMEDYAESITAERVKRVAKGYGEGNKKVEGTGGNFDFYELGQPLFIGEHTLNEEVETEKIREYIFFTETKHPLPKKISQNPYFLDSFQHTDYYFFYEKERLTTLNHDFLNTLEKKSEQYLIYADICTLSEQFLRTHSIVFKKIPRDISRF